MQINVKKVDTGELLYENLEATDIILGTTKADTRIIICLPNKEKIILSPKDNYKVYHTSTEDAEPKSLANQFQELTYKLINLELALCEVYEELVRRE